MSEDSETDGRPAVTEEDATNEDGTRYKTLVVDKSGASTDDDS